MFFISNAIKNRIIAFLILMIPFILMAQQESGIMAVISDVQGNVLVHKIQRNGPIKGVFGLQLTQGDQVKTDKRSAVTILFSSGNLLSARFYYGHNHKGKNCREDGNNHNDNPGVYFKGVSAEQYYRTQEQGDHTAGEKHSEGRGKDLGYKEYEGKEHK